jgi:riboflavin kinase/FMN adenylyltransferase
MTSRRGPIVVLGEFDGVHRGHRALVDAAWVMSERLGVPLVAVVLDRAGASARITTVEERCVALLRARASEVHAVAVDVRNDEARRAVVDGLLARFGPAAVVVACVPETLPRVSVPRVREELAARGVPVVEVERARDADGRSITSALVRDAIEAGDVARAGVLLDRRFEVTGTVVRGQRLGHTIGFPTANVVPPPGRVLPARGVYAAVVTVEGGERRTAAVNIGVRPTVSAAGQLLIEAHLVDFDDDIYDRRITIAFVERLRGERRFESLDALSAQLATDVAHAVDVLPPDHH